MRRARRNQRDLFDDAASVTEPLPDLRSKLAPLLRTLLAEAAVVEARSKSDGRGGKEAGDDEDHG